MKASLRGWAALAGLCVAAGWSSPAAAYANDPQLWKLGSPMDRPGNPSLVRDPLAQERFARFSSELGLALLPLPAGLSSTVGDAGFDFSFSGDFALVSPTATFSDGSTGDVWMTEERLTGPLFLPTVHFRKGLPLSFEVDTSVSYVTASRLIAASGSVKWGLIEGFQWWPDLAARAFVTVLVGGGPLNLTVAGWDVGGGYRIPLMGSAELGLYGGFQRVGISASTNSIDFDPANEDDAVPQADDAVFNPLSFGSNPIEPNTSFNRIYFGAQVRVGLMVIGVDAAYASGSNRIDQVSTVKFDTALWKVAGRIGVQF